jgi:hypothetical protein
MAFRFACARCGCPSVRLPAELTAQSLVACDQCNAPLTTWAEFKRLTTSIVLSEQSDQTLEGASYDPLAADPVDPVPPPPALDLVLLAKPKVA